MLLNLHHLTLHTTEPGGIFIWQSGKGMQNCLQRRFLPKRWILLITKIFLNFSVDKNTINCPRGLAVSSGDSGNSKSENRADTQDSM